MFVIVDGSGLIHTEYHANCPFTPREYEGNEEILNMQIDKDSHGRYVNAIGGFMRVLMSIIEDFNPDYLAVCFDKNRYTTFRRKLFPAYKGNRGPTPEPLVQQVNNIKKILTDCGIPILESETYEADDYAGSLAKRFGSEGEQIYIYTKDRDYLQLVNSNVRLWLRKANPFDVENLEDKYPNFGFAPEMCFEITEDIVKEEYGVYPVQIPDLKAISGDTADNIPGVKGVADKSAVPLLNEYGNIEGIYAKLSEYNTPEGRLLLKQIWKEELGLKRSPIDNLLRDTLSAYMSKQLATIFTSINVGKKSDYAFNVDWDVLIREMNDYGQSIIGARAAILKSRIDFEKKNIEIL